MNMRIDEQLKKRLQSLAWRTGMMIIAAVIAGVSEEFGSEMPAWAVVGLGLVAGEISKYLNTTKK